MLCCSDIAGTAHAPGQGKTTLTLRRRRRCLLFCYIKVRSRSCHSYPLRRHCVIYDSNFRYGWSCLVCHVQPKHVKLVWLLVFIMQTQLLSNKNASSESNLTYCAFVVFQGDMWICWAKHHGKKNTLCILSWCAIEPNYTWSYTTHLSFCPR